ncbi:hypothetical protein SAMD00019534_049080, partial [Acytostelium subglobosum LB1]|uniref:hypothetical protein n=1 Tax=Acytostelium subglobosum LB1 TaxID=1410327 RepID=UPI0006449B01
FLYITMVLLTNDIIVTPTEAVDLNKFKQCNDQSFCRVNRNIEDDPSRIHYKIVPSSLHIDTEGRLQADLIEEGLADKEGHSDREHPLSLEIRALEDDTIRMTITEKVSVTKNKRYQVNDVLLPNIEYAPIKTLHMSSDNDATFEFGRHSYARIQYRPFKLDVFVDDILAISANERSFFKFERTLTHPAPDTKWPEMFRDHPDSRPRGPMSVAMDISFIGTSHVYGIPEHTTSLALRSTRGNKINDNPYRLYNLDVFEYELDKTTALYGAVPLMLSHDANKTVGVFWLNSAETFIDVSDGINSKYTHWISETGVMDVFFLTGPTPLKVFSQYAALTGTTALPQLFSLGYHQCRWNYVSQQDVEEVDSGFDDNSIPYDVMWLDIEHTNEKRYFTWDKANFGSPKDMLAKIEAKGRKMVSIVDPHIMREPSYYIYNEAKSNKYFVNNNKGEEYVGYCWPGDSSYIDFTNPQARDWWASQFAYNKYQGSTPILYTWNDMNEPSVFNGPEVSMNKDALHYGNAEHREVHNLYGFYQHMATAKGLVDRNTDKNDRPFVLSRSFFAGTQRFGPIWTGDNAAKWSHLKAAQPMLLSLGLTGITFSGADVGGFFGNPDGELLARWYQAGSFQPFFRGHSHHDTKRREPWLFGDPYLGIIKAAILRRYTYLPLWYTLFYQNTLTGAPTMRPLWVEFPSDPSLFAVDNEFMVGNSLLVVPVVEQGAKTTRVMLPGGDTQTWYDIDTLKRYFACHMEVATPLDKIPVYQRGGTIVPKKERVRPSTKHMVDDPYTLVVALSATQQARGELYIDDGHSFDYQKGQYLYRSFVYNHGKIQSSSMDNSAVYKPASTVERIVVMGVDKRPSSVTREGHNLPFEYDRTMLKLTIDKLYIPISSNWLIEVE